MNDRTDLHAAILNLPVPRFAPDDSAVVRAFQQGFRDARHAAAELVSAHAVPAERFPPRPEGYNGADTDPSSPLERWGKPKHEGGALLLQPVDDGYWTPWHIANELLRASGSAAPTGEQPKSKSDVVDSEVVADDIGAPDKPLDDEALAGHLRSLGTITWRDCWNLAEHLRREGVVAYQTKPQGDSNA